MREATIMKIKISYKSINMLGCCCTLLSTCAWFLYLEKHVTTDFHVIETSLDDKIPFIEYFIIPYLLWFAFIAVTIGYFFFTDKAGYYKLTAFLFTGMTIFLIVSTRISKRSDPAPCNFCKG